jgi:hypothetical protein
MSNLSQGDVCYGCCEYFKFLGEIFSKKGCIYTFGPFLNRPTYPDVYIYVLFEEGLNNSLSVTNQNKGFHNTTTKKRLF